MSNIVKALISGELVESKTDQYVDMVSPLSNEVIGKVPCMLESEIDDAVQKAHKAYLLWRFTPVMTRTRVMLKYQALVKENMQELATILCEESGKTFDDAKGDLVRGYEVIEFCVFCTYIINGRKLFENVANKVNTYSYKQAIGVCAGITPFNFSRYDSFMDVSLINSSRKCIYFKTF